MLKVIENVSTKKKNRSEMLSQKTCKKIQRESFLKHLKIGPSLLSSHDSFNSSFFNHDTSQSGPFICAITSNADESFLHNSSPAT
ncbi:unnamed protein product [Larinioides sclopetarius]|uniref:Uncharacterized protein n=1 Tax=Larinioides sclopetarius TaxID=280406 RepID=A0AAV1Z787_9ARAC